MGSPGNRSVTPHNYRRVLPDAGGSERPENPGGVVVQVSSRQQAQRGAVHPEPPCGKVPHVGVKEPAGLVPCHDIASLIGDEKRAAIQDDQRLSHS